MKKKNQTFKNAFILKDVGGLKNKTAADFFFAGSCDNCDQILKASYLVSPKLAVFDLRQYHPVKTLHTIQVPCTT